MKTKQQTSHLPQLDFEGARLRGFEAAIACHELHRNLRVYAQHLFGNQQDAFDAVQQALLLTIRAYRDRVHSSEVPRICGKVLYNLAQRHYQYTAKRRMLSLEALEDVQDVQACSFGQADHSGRVYGIVSQHLERKLGTKKMEAIRLLEQGYNTSEVAERMGTTTNVVRVYRHKARKALGKYTALLCD